MARFLLSSGNTTILLTIHYRKFGMTISRKPLKSALWVAVAMAGLLTVDSANAATNLAATATVDSISSFFMFSTVGIAVVPDGQAIAENNLLTSALVPYTSNGETRYIFSASDAAPSVTIELASPTVLKSFGATWFDSAYQDRAPSGVTISLSSNGSDFTDITDFTTTDTSGSEVITLADGESADFVKYTFGVPGGTPTVANAVAIASLSAVAVPEPATWALMLTGFGLIGYAMRKRASVRSQTVNLIDA